MTGTTEISQLSRDKIKQALARNPRLKNQLEQCRRTDDSGHIWWQPDEARVRNVIMKLAQGHAAYELGEYWNGQPDLYTIPAIATMTTEEIQDFENLEDYLQPLWPEIGCRAFLR
ncbi:hypothetical protein QO167_29540, partial [Pseudomonas aeruginosa]|nr:hypothetical protein [Pseudomonas aeruginosa]